METAPLVPMRTILLEAFEMFKTKALTIMDLQALTKFPVAYIYLDETYVATDWIELYVTYEYAVPKEYTKNILGEMVKNMKVLEFQELSIGTEKKQYVNLNHNPLEINCDELRNFFNNKSHIQ